MGPSDNQGYFDQGWDIDSLRDWVNNNRDQARILTGMTYIGKTMMAAQLCSTEFYLLWFYPME